ncbi:MAG: DUF1778 domain-containing protein [Phycisphaerae bacterium]|nr:DUF1778 domain-containing protein [Phycisphaerae bacterium]
MPEASTLTIRIDSDLKEELEAAAKAADQSVTEFVVRSVKERMAGSCPACGRDGGGRTTLSPGLTSTFADWVTGLRASCKVAIATAGPEGHRVFVGTTGPNGLHDSHLDLEVRAGPYCVDLKVARSSIVMWARDQEADKLHRSLVPFDYVDGNHLVRMKLAAAEGRRRS